MQEGAGLEPAHYLLMKYPGFKVMSPERLREVASLGGRTTAHRRMILWRRHRFLPGSRRAREMGRLGGLASAAKRAAAALLVTLVAIKGGWLVTFTPSYDNVGVEILIECKQSGYRHVLFQHVDGDSQDAAMMRPFDMPKGRCTAIVNVLRNQEQGVGDPANDYVSESTIVILPEPRR